MIKIDIYLIEESKGYTFRFPVDPLDKITIQKERRFSTVDILDFGEVDLFERGEKIDEITISTFFPKEYDESYCKYSNIMDPKDCISLLTEWKDYESPIRLIITDINFNSLINISKFTVEDRAGEAGDKYITITFRKYREAKITLNVEATNTSGLQDNRSSTQTSEFNKGDKVKVTASALNVRSGPGTNNSILGSVPNGKVLEIYRVDGNWADVYWGVSGGFICLDYVTKV